MQVNKCVRLYLKQSVLLSTVWTAPGRRRVGVRALLIHLGLRLLLANVQLQEKGNGENQTQAGKNNVLNRRLLCPQRDNSLSRNILVQGCCTRRADRVLGRQIYGTTAGRVEVDSVFTTSMLGDSLMLNTNHITAAYIHPDTKYIRMFCNLCSMTEFRNINFMIQPWDV